MCRPRCTAGSRIAPFQVGGEWQITQRLAAWCCSSRGLRNRRTARGNSGQRSCSAVERALATGTAPHALVVLHHPPVPMDSPGLDELGLLDGPAVVGRRRRGIRGCAASAGVTRTRRSTCLPRRNDVRFMCTPATSMQFKPRNAHFEVDDRPPGYRVIDLQRRRLDRVRSRVARGLRASARVGLAGAGATRVDGGERDVLCASPRVRGRSFRESDAFRKPCAAWTPRPEPMDGFTAFFGTRRTPGTPAPDALAPQSTYRPSAPALRQRRPRRTRRLNPTAAASSRPRTRSPPRAGRAPASHPA